MITRNLKRKAYRRAVIIDNVVMAGLIAVFGYLFIIELFNY